MKRAIFGLLALTLLTGWASPGWAAGLTLTPDVACVHARALAVAA